MMPLVDTHMTERETPTDTHTHAKACMFEWFLHISVHSPQTGPAELKSLLLRFRNSDVFCLPFHLRSFPRDVRIN